MALWGEALKWREDIRTIKYFSPKGTYHSGKWSEVGLEVRFESNDGALIANLIAIVGCREDSNTMTIMGHLIAYTFFGPKMVNSSASLERGCEPSSLHSWERTIHSRLF